MGRLARLVVRYPLLVLALWIAAVGAIVAITPAGDAVVTKAPYPTAAQRARGLLDAAFPATGSGNHPPTSILLSDPRGLSAGEDMLVGLAIPRLRSWSYADMGTGWNPPSQPVVANIDGPHRSKDGKALLVNITYTFTGYCYPCNDYLRRALGSIRPHLPPGAAIEITGLGLVYQAEDDALAGITSGGVTPTLLACVALLLVILGVVYRAPLAVLVPLVCIGTCVYTSLGLVKYLSAHTDWVPHGNITDELISVALFGAGTNYCIFLLSRYRETLRAGLQPREAIVLAVTRVGEAITSSAGTVIAAMTLMGLTLSPMFRAIGPSVAVAVAVMLLGGLTLVPAAVRLCGSAFLWPSQPQPASGARHSSLDVIQQPRPVATSDQHPGGPPAGPARGLGFWEKVGAVIVAHPGRILVATLALLVGLSAFAFALSPSYDDLRALPSDNPAVRAAEAIQAHFGSITEPATLVIADPTTDLGGSAGSATTARLRATLAASAGVVGVGVPTIAPDRHVAALPFTLGVETSSPAAHAAIARLQEALATTVAALGRPNLQALISSDSAATHDQAVQVGADFRFIITWVSLVILAILALLVRSLTAPLYLLLTVALSAASSIGLTVLVCHLIFGQEIYYTTPVFAFVFLVALGEDFNILLMSRIREEVRRHGLRLGVARAVGSTGGTLTSCGLIMAGTFGVLITFRVTFLQQIGFAVGAGVLLDTFVVRSLLVPSIVCLLGRWNWVGVRGAAPLPEPSDGSGLALV